MIRFRRDVCDNLNEASSREWLETNGLGGFASSTIIGLNTRRYHGLLVAATKPPVGRYLLVSKLEETLLLDGRAFDLSTNRYPSVVHPQGFRYLKEFRLDPFPVFTYEIEGIEIEKTVFMVQGENSTIIQYQLGNMGGSKSLPEQIALELRPLIAFRDYHSTTHENTALNAAVASLPGLASITPYPGLPSLHLAHNARQLESGHASWYRNLEYEAERERGLDFTEDLFNPCLLRFDLRPGAGAMIIASTQPRDAASVDEYRQAEISRRVSIVRHAPIKDAFVESLTTAADQFIVARGKQKTVIAGYHWFSDWGRDTMIALPGLTLTTGRYDVARSILRTFARHVDRGMLPNRFPDADETPEYNTVDATLWFIEAVRSYLAYTDDLDFVDNELYGVLTEIISWHVGGTRFGIKVDSNGLLSSGELGVQLTWMDAKVGDWVVTPRCGKPVEIQALWYNALCVMQDIARRLGDEISNHRYGAMAALTSETFNRLFWNEKSRCLFDVVNGGPPDASIRPNQIFAVSLPHTMLNPARANRVLDVVQEHLLTPFGLRTLAPSDPQYRGRYTGDQASRDGAYHQGTVWPWLMGPFLTAYIKVHGRSEPARRQAESWLSAFKDLLSDSGLGQVSEIFEGDEPHRPVGCIAQAWSVAELLRATVEDVYGVRPEARTSSVLDNRDGRYSMTLQQKLDDFKAQFESGGPPYNAPMAVIEIFHRATEELRQSGLAERALKTGDRAPAFTLNNQDGTPISSVELLAKGPLAITFFRGHW
ncbi:MAG: amylo-alpha-1,6-glucosidase [Candidatus Sulfotelmatobacter sp.]